MGIDQSPDYDGASRFSLKFLTPFVFGWIGLSGLGFLTALFSRDSFTVLVMLFSGGIVALILGFLSGFLVDVDGLLKLPVRSLRKRIWICISLSVLLPVGCSHFQSYQGMSEKELSDYYFKHKDVLSEIVRLCKADKTAAVFIYRDEPPKIEGRPATVSALKVALAKLPDVDQVWLKDENVEIEFVLSSTSPGFFEFTKRGLLYCEKLSEEDQEAPTNSSFDDIKGYDTRYVRTIAGPWRMFHVHISD
ncbi:MAG: hypothetical protein WCK51_04835 [Armatimonadota bacterium]